MTSNATLWLMRESIEAFSVDSLAWYAQLEACVKLTNSLPYSLNSGSRYNELLSARRTTSKTPSLMLGYAALADASGSAVQARLWSQIVARVPRTRSVESPQVFA